MLEKRERGRSPFKAKLRHYHRSAAPDLYDEKQKRWVEVSPTELSDTEMPKVSEIPNVSKRLDMAKDAGSDI
ncbi:hypothetical protein HW115_16960 [Verrucomicrobiaceae bacterium N1E253]|uniref:Uncharacterized protein n=1 Tax=Oceaniferula marina TaxID=2748318 RepID=A0A851GIH5_9BACT|nr:hypothetical protein [Oceaniferula marina]NWK57313.1 hypothetical protein [Oceaniferula marina]